MLQVNNKFKLGDEVFFLNEKLRRVKGVIEGISVHIFSGDADMRVNYDLKKVGWKSECELFASEAEMKHEIFNQPLLEFV